MKSPELAARASRSDLDPEVAQFVTAARGTLFPTLDGLPAGRLRATINAALLSHDVPGYEPEPVFAVERSTLGDVPVRIYFPATQPRAVIVYFHGGGFVAGSLDTHDKTTRRLANGVGAIVVSVDYRLSPEHPFPLPWQDSIIATTETARRYPHLPLIVAGDSAGGALAASVAQWARDTALVEIAGQALLYPVVDFDLDTDSMERFGADYLLTRGDLAMYRRYYLHDAPPHVEYALPGSMADLTALPPAVIALAGFDPLRDEGARYALRLVEAGVTVDLIENGNLIHGWLEIAEVIHAASAAREHVVAAIRRLITPPGT